MINIVLYQPEIPQNTGNIIRTAMAIGARVHLIKPLGFSLDEKSLLRASMDYIEEVDIIEYENYEDFKNKNPNCNIFFVTRYANETYSDFDFSDVTEDYYFMFGKESSGIPYDILRDHQDRLLRIPMMINARSLNLSNCVAIVVYEALRQQEYYNLSTFETIKGEDFLNK
jgi:tRNA (cytidine/uridine-2'-O-)-methyltransferase